MQPKLPTLVVRHRKEKLKKCTLLGLEERKDFTFFRWPSEITLPPVSYVYLTLDAPVLTENDKDMGLILIDATWRLADEMTRGLKPWLSPLEGRSLPPEIRTAYPRKQTACSDPDRGLASIEALFAAYKILGWETSGLLDRYHWREQFLSLNGF